MQALEVMHELQKNFPIKRSPMRLRLYVPEKNYSSLLEKLNIWNATIVSKDDFGNQPSIVSLVTFYLFTGVFTNGGLLSLIYSFPFPISVLSASLLLPSCLFKFQRIACTCSWVL